MYYILLALLPQMVCRYLNLVYNSFQNTRIHSSHSASGDETPASQKTRRLPSPFQPKSRRPPTPPRRQTTKTAKTERSSKSTGKTRPNAIPARTTQQHSITSRRRRRNTNVVRNTASTEGTTRNTTGNTGRDTIPAVKNSPVLQAMTIIGRSLLQTL